MNRPIALLLLVLAAWLGPRACGQTFFDEIAPALSREDYSIIASRLALTNEQREAADRLFEGYLAEHGRNAAAFKKAWKDFGFPKRDAEGKPIQEFEAERGRILTEATERYRTLKPGTQRAFLKDLRALVEESQAAAGWEGVERFIRRQLMARLSGRGAVEWQRPDLLRGVFLLKLAPEALAKVQPLLDEYELLLDKPLRRMEAVPVVQDEEAERSWQEAVLELRSTNRRYLRLIAQELPPDASARLTQWARDKAYWQLAMWDGGIVRDGFQDAKKLATFSGEQRARAEALIAEMEKVTAELRREAEPDFDEVDEKMMRMSDREWKAAMERPDNPLGAVSWRWSARYDELYRGWMERMELILTQEQRREAWPPDGKLLDAGMAKARKRLE